MTYYWTVEEKEREEQEIKVIFISVLSFSTEMEPRSVSFFRTVSNLQPFYILKRGVRRHLSSIILSKC